MNLFEQPKIIKKYLSRWYLVLLVALEVALFCLYLAVVHFKTENNYVWELWLLILPPVVILYSKLIFYTVIDIPAGSVEKRLFFHHGGLRNMSWFPIRDLQAILHETSFFAKREKGTIYFVANGKFRRRISELRYTKQIMGELIRDLKKINPVITLDEYTTFLAQQVEQKP